MKNGIGEAFLEAALAGVRMGALKPSEPMSSAFEEIVQNPPTLSYEAKAGMLEGILETDEIIRERIHKYMAIVRALLERQTTKREHRSKAIAEFRFEDADKLHLRIRRTGRFIARIHARKNKFVEERRQNALDIFSLKANVE